MFNKKINLKKVYGSVLMLAFLFTSVFGGAVAAKPENPGNGGGNGNGGDNVNVCFYADDESVWKIISPNINGFENGMAGKGDGETENFIIEDGDDQALCDSLINGDNGDGDSKTLEAPENLRSDEPALSCGATTDSYTIVAAWDESVSSLGIDKYEYWVITPQRNEDNAWTTFVGGTSRLGEFNEGEGDYTFKVRAIDSEGDESDWSETCTITYSTEIIAEPTYPQAEIILPATDYDEYSDEDEYLVLEAFYDDGEVSNPRGVQWAVRQGTCSANTNTVFGNVDGKNTPEDWDGNNFLSSILISEFPEDGDYCFVFNPKDKAGDPDTRLTRWFVIDRSSDDESEESEETEEKDNDDNQETESEPVKKGGSKGIGSMSIGGVLGLAFEPQGQVLGVSTCENTIDSYIKMGAQNNVADVMKLQNFLNEELELNLEITGIYNAETQSAVNAFQLKHYSKILEPWVNLGVLAPNTPTGYFFITTKWWANAIICGNEETAAMPAL